MRALQVLLFMLLVFAGAQASTVVLPEDEFILPPLFKRLITRDFSVPDGVNVSSGRGLRRRAVPGEWFDYGDSVSLMDALAMEVNQSEDVAWVAGGVFQGRLGRYNRTQSNLIQYSLDLEHGWVRVWIRPGSRNSLMRIEANQDSIIATDAEFWLNARTGFNEIYVLKGRITSLKMGRNFAQGTYLKARAGSASPERLSENWDSKAMEVQIATAFPSLVHLSEKVDEDWNSGRTQQVYAEYRRKGWRKAHRLEPAPPK